MFFVINKYLNFPCKILSSCLLRIVLSLFTSFVINLYFGPYFISYLKKLQTYQIIRNNGPKTHIAKKNTPTMGGILILISILISIFLYCNLFNIYVWYTISILIGYGLIGFLDDFKKIKNHNSIGLKIIWKFFWLSIIAIIISTILYYNENYFLSVRLVIPFYTTMSFKLNYLYIFISYLVIVGTGNGANLTDGLDGLAIVPVIFISCVLGIVAFLSSNIHFSYITNVIFIKDANDLIILCTAIIGSGIGFLWFNTYPAKIFMGDVGSLSLGGTLGIIAILLHQELLLFILGGVFVIETVSVILQVTYFKIKKRRILKMAPIHHHYELIGIVEPLIIVRFWIISFLLSCISIISLLKVYY